MSKGLEGLICTSKLVIVAALLVLCSGAAMAQDFPKVEAFAGYSYIRFNLGGDTAGVVHGNFNGGVGSVSFNPTKSLGLVAEFGGYRFSKLSQTQSFSAKSGVFSYLFGPRFSLRRERITPFAQVLFGGIRHGDVTSTDPAVCAPAAAGCTIVGSENAFAMALGGGVDIKAGKHVSIRLGQIEYLLTRFKDASSTPTRANQNNFRYSAGIVFH